MGAKPQAHAEGQNMQERFRHCNWQGPVYQGLDPGTVVAIYIIS